MAESINISMFSSAEKVEGQGVASAYREQVDLVADLPELHISLKKLSNVDIGHYHTIDLKHYLLIPFIKSRGAAVGYVHFLPETIEGSLKLPGFIKYIFYKYMISFYKKMDYLVTVNPYFIEKLANYGIDSEKIIYIPNFVSDNSFFLLPETEVKEQKRKWAISEDKFVVLGVGQVQTRKGVLDFIDVAKRLPEVQFIWAGGFSFGKITEGYKELKEILENPPENVLFTGIIPREEMNFIYNIADLLFMPSYNELFPMSILEAMSCHIPLLLRDIPLYEVILDGYYQKGKTIEEFSNIIKKLEKDNRYYLNAQQAAIAGNRHYSREHVKKLWLQFYQRVYSEKVAVN